MTRDLHFVLIVLALLSFRAESAEMATLPQLYGGSMLPSVEVETLSHCGKVLPSAPVRHSDAVRPLPAANKPFPAIRRRL